MIDWTRPVCTKHETPHIGDMRPPCPMHGRRRVAIFSPSALGFPTNDQGKLTVFRYDDDGRTRGDGKPSANDLVNYHPEDGKVRIDLNGRAITCDGRKAA